MIDLVPDELQAEVGGVAAEAFGALALRPAASVGDTQWRSLAELGVFGVAVAEADGGVGLGLAGATLVAEAAGAAIAPIGVLATVAAAGDERCAASMIDGSARAALGVPRGDAQWTVVDLAPDGVLLLVADDDVIVIDAGEIAAAEPLESLDEGAALWSVAVDPAVIDTARTRGTRPAHSLRLLLAAAAVGVSRRARDRATEYAMTRKQFGAAIGSFQAVKHRCVDMAVRHEAALASVRFAAVRADAGLPDTVADATAAFMASAAAIDNAASAIQVYGGIGFTAENGLQHLIHRAWLLQLLVGAPAGHGEVLLRVVTHPAGQQER
jgi:alkylation response protein AidB-like acyl-CoA dehydrogenase